MLRQVGGLVRHDRPVRPGGSMTNPSKAPRAGGNLSLQHGGDPVAQAQVRRPDDARRDAYLAVPPARAYGGDALDELRFTDDLELLRAVRPVHRRAPRSEE